MGLFSAIFGSDRPDGRYRSEMQQLSTKVNHLAWNHDQLAALQDQGYPLDTPIKLSHYYTTDTEKKATQLASALTEISYPYHIVPPSDDDPDCRINAVSTPQLLTEESLNEWTNTLCDRAATYDCEFAAWQLPTT